MNYLSEKDLSTFFEQNNNQYKNSAGMRIGLSPEEEVWTFLAIYDPEVDFSISISTQEDSLQEFIESFRIESRRDIDNLDYNNSWMRYLNGAATITVNPLELEADISFRIVRSKTIVFSMDMHFYDEVHEHLTLLEDFQKYLTDHEMRLMTANMNRYLISRN